MVMVRGGGTCAPPPRVRATRATVRAKGGGAMLPLTLPPIKPLPQVKLAAVVAPREEKERGAAPGGEERRAALESMERVSCTRRKRAAVVVVEGAPACCKKRGAAVLAPLEDRRVAVESTLEMAARAVEIVAGGSGVREAVEPTEGAWGGSASAHVACRRDRVLFKKSVELLLVPVGGCASVAAAEKSAMVVLSSVRGSVLVAEAAEAEEEASRLAAPALKADKRSFFAASAATPLLLLLPCVAMSTLLAEAARATA